MDYICLDMGTPPSRLQTYIWILNSASQFIRRPAESARTQGSRDQLRHASSCPGSWESRCVYVEPYKVHTLLRRVTSRIAFSAMAARQIPGNGAPFDRQDHPPAGANCVLPTTHGAILGQGGDGDGEEGLAAVVPPLHQRRARLLTALLIVKSTRQNTRFLAFDIGLHGSSSISTKPRILTCCGVKFFVAMDRVSKTKRSPPHRHPVCLSQTFQVNILSLNSRRPSS